MAQEKSKSLKELALEAGIAMETALEAVRKTGKYDTVMLNIPVFGERLEFYQQVISGIAPETAPETEQSAEKKTDSTSPVQPRKPKLSKQQQKQKEIFKTKEFLKQCTEKNYLIIIDTCSILGKGTIDGKLYFSFPLFMKYAESVLKASGKKIIVPYIVREEMRRQIENKPGTEEAERSTRMLAVIEKWEQKDCLQIVGGEEDWNHDYSPHADNFLFNKISEFKDCGQNTLLITQDGGLAGDVRNIMNLQHYGHKKSIKAEIVVRKLDIVTGVLRKPKLKKQQNKR
ncbi:MAG: hypothetical protein E7496_05520 [Ruminococcus sp.]|nr:hypothetical protein [Ruminococcus sp.]